MCRFRYIFAAGREMSPKGPDHVGCKGVTIARGRYSLCCFPVSVNRGVVKVFQ